MITNIEKVKYFRGICGNIYELLNPKNSMVKDFNITIAEIEPNMSAEKHYHNKTQEVYYVLEGNGEILIGNKIHNIKSGDCILINIGDIHQLINSTNSKLCVLIVNSPPYDDSDSILV